LLLDFFFLLDFLVFFGVDAAASAFLRSSSSCAADDAKTQKRGCQPGL
jgi:hypothetical protein